MAKEGEIKKIKKKYTCCSVNGDRGCVVSSSGWSFFGRARCLRGPVLQRQSDWACKHATTLYPRQGLGRWRCGGGNDGGGKPAFPLPSPPAHKSLSFHDHAFRPPPILIFPRSRIKAFFSSQAPPPPPPLPSLPAPHGTTSLNRGV